MLTAILIVLVLVLMVAGLVAVQTQFGFFASEVFGFNGTIIRVALELVGMLLKQ